MAGTSDNYNLTLPELEDKITESIPQIAENFSEIDRVMKANEEKIDTDIAEAIDTVEAELKKTNTEVDSLEQNLAETKAEWTNLFDGAVKAVFGAFAGRGGTNVTVSLGFTPVAVLLLGNGGSCLKNGNYYTGGLAFEGHSVQSGATNILKIVENGFMVTSDGSSSSTGKSHFIAFKNGEIKVVS